MACLFGEGVIIEKERLGQFLWSYTKCVWWYCTSTCSFVSRRIDAVSVPFDWLVIYTVSHCLLTCECLVSILFRSLYLAIVQCTCKWVGLRSIKLVVVKFPLCQVPQSFNSMLGDDYSLALPYFCRSVRICLRPTRVGRELCHSEANNGSSDALWHSWKVSAQLISLYSCMWSVTDKQQLYCFWMSNGYTISRRPFISELLSTLVTEKFGNRANDEDFGGPSDPSEAPGNFLFTHYGGTNYVISPEADSSSPVDHSPVSLLYEKNRSCRVSSVSLI